MIDKERLIKHIEKENKRLEIKIMKNKEYITQLKDSLKEKAKP